MMMMSLPVVVIAEIRSSSSAAVANVVHSLSSLKIPFHDDEYDEDHHDDNDDHEDEDVMTMTMTSMEIDEDNDYDG